jgi:hypothetical protein
MAVSVVVTGLLIGSAIAAGVDPRNSDLRTNLADAALIVYVVSTVLAVALVAALMWRLIRPKVDGRRGSD